MNCDKTKSFWCFFGPTPLDIPSITLKGKAIDRVTSTKLLGVIISNDLGSFEAGGCDKHSYSKDIRLTCPLAVGICLPSVAHGSYCIGYGPIKRVTEGASKIAFPELPYECALIRATIDTLNSLRRDLSRRFFRCLLSPTHKSTIYCLLHVWCLIIS